MSSIQSALKSQSLPLSEAFSVKDSKPKAAGPDENKAAKEFESVFTSMLLKEMRQSLEPNSLFAQDSGDVYGGMFDMFMGQHLAQAGGLGLAKVILESLNHQKHDVTSATRPNVAKP